MRENWLLNDRVVVITGGAGLIGRRFSSVVAEHGGIAVVADLDAGAAAAVADEISVGHEGKVLAVEIDVTSQTSIDALISDLHERFGHVDAVVNNAYPKNKNFGRKFGEVGYQDFCENVGMHLGGYFLVAQQFSQYFRQQGGGKIVNMASVYGLMAPRFEIYDETEMTMPVEYAAIKAAIIHLTKYLAKCLKGTGISVNAISPGGIHDRQPDRFVQAYGSNCLSKGMLDVRDLDGTLVFLLSDMSAYVNGQNLVVDDGFSL